MCDVAERIVERLHPRPAIAVNGPCRHFVAAAEPQRRDAGLRDLWVNPEAHADPRRDFEEFHHGFLFRRFCEIAHFWQVRQRRDLAAVADDMAKLTAANPCGFACGPARPVIHPAVDFAAFHRLVDLCTTLVAFDNFEFCDFRVKDLKFLVLGFKISNYKL